ncbi:MAG TPA: PHB depolymerase family esterase [Solirubrobacteraceae bacterium]|nr:PHB depolymerase family esterase [Solirubrobacteraceae bacterium]
MRALGVLAVTALVACGCGSPDSDEPPTAARPAPATATSDASAAAGACDRSAPAPPATVPAAPLDTILRVPANVRGTRAPLVLALHFASGSGSEMEAASRATPAARRAGFVIAYPSASSGGVWAGAGELGALTRTLRAIERVACIDPRRVYVAGVSNGGGMAHLFACRNADRIAGIVLFAPAVSGIGDCRPSRPVSMLEFHGTADDLVAYGPIPQFVADWARLDGCSSSDPRRTSAGRGVQRQRWRGCRGGASVEHLRLNGGGHIELLPQLRAAGVDPAREALRFLARHRLPA